MVTNVFTVIFDMDDVLVNWDKGFQEAFEKKFPGLQYKTPQERGHWWLPHNYPEEIQSDIGQIAFEEDFFENLSPKEGALEAVQWVMQQGHGTAICSSPLWTPDPVIVGRCMAEKVKWINRYFGHITPLFNPDSKLQVTLTHDKTLVHGDVLIDDRPEIKGICTPTWTHLLFDENHKFTEHCTQEKINWTNYKPIIQRHFHKWQQKKSSL